jgi:NhaP-type Na+/H+ or K+/H+ antiporter
MFAIVGTGFSAIAIGFLTKYLTEFGGTSLPLLDSLLFGSLISSIDPVATLGILQGVGVNPTDTLYTLIFGESLLNDGVAIVLFETLVRHLGDHDVVTKANVQETFARFALVSVGSMLIGMACGLICTLYFMALRGKHSAVTEVAVFFCWALVPYYISDGAGLSGIIAIMTMGFFMDYFVIGGFQSEEVEWMDYMELRRDNELREALASAERASTSRCSRFFCCCCNAVSKALSGCGHLSSRSRKHVGFVTEVVASVMETAIFAYLGLFLFQDHAWNLRLNGIAIFGCVLSRAAMIVLLSIVINFFVWIDFENRLARLCACLFCCTSTGHDDESTTSFPTKAYLDQKTQCIILLAGVRGAVSFALVENIPVYDAVTKHGSKFKAELKAMTASSILITLFVFGALTYFTVQEHRRSDPEQVVASPLTRRLLSGPLTSTIEEEAGEDSSSESSASEAVTERRGTGRRGQPAHR